MEHSELERFNHWWIRGSVDPDLALPLRRFCYGQIWGRMPSRFMIALVGLRRVGKTTIMYQMIQDLIAGGTDATDILFFSFDESDAKVGEVIDAYVGFHNKDLRAGRVYVFLDEIQKCADWENEAKKYYDLYPKIKFVLSGSESLFIRKRTKENLAGRLLESRLHTFSLAEYLGFHGIKRASFKYETVVNPLFLKFVRRGGFPETFNMENDKDFVDYVKALVVDKVVYKDIPKLFNIEDPEFLRVLLELVATNPGMYIDYQSLSRQFGKDRRVVKDYFSYLENSFLIRILGNYRKGSAASLRKRKRAYPSDTAIAYVYKHDVDNTFLGRLVETVAVNASDAKAFWRNSTEVDMVVGGFPVEIKYQDRITDSDFKSVAEFMKRFKVNRGTLVTKRDEGDIRVEHGRIRKVPAWKWAVGDNGPLRGKPRGGPGALPASATSAFRAGQ